MVSEVKEEGEGEGAERALPPIFHVLEPPMQHMSTRIRWYHALGYKPAEIQKRTGVLYQQVRNVITTQPKRAAREDLPPLEIRLAELDDDFEAMDKHHLELQMAAARDEARKAAARARSGAARRKKGPAGDGYHVALPGEVEEGEVDEITEQE